MSKKDMGPDRCEEILQNAETGYLAMSLNDRPYCIPFNFWYDRDRSRIYIHTGLAGMKWDIITGNPSVCFTVAVPGRKRTGESPCSYSYEFESVIVYGKAFLVDNRDETVDSLNRLIDKYREGPAGQIPEDKLTKLRMLRIDIEKITGRQNRQRSE
ncbi:MAG: hypothetical protein CVU89_13315 [Firmicutes bacterium HGW-Firmicutes-14]|nr:MAG: hypothetical protein CVU89_13315 [Firmicutes bacterium HGW-Firmicutes-14]